MKTGMRDVNNIQEANFFLEPLSPLVFRSGLPFGEVGDTGSAAGPDFPLPGMIAGALRNAWCDATSYLPRAEDNLISTLAVHGPLRCTRKDNEAPKLWLPAPADARMLSTPKGIKLARLWPREACENNGCDLPHGLSMLRAVGDNELEPPPAWWSASAVATWLGAINVPCVGDNQSTLALPRAPRIHLAVDEDREAVDGALFKTSAIDFTEPATGGGQPGFWLRVRWPKTLKSPMPGAPSVADGLTKLAGQPWRVGADGGLAAFHRLPDTIMTETATAAYDPKQTFARLAAGLSELEVGDVIRMLLVTPACYMKNGWYPDGLRLADDSAQAPSGRLVGMPKNWVLRLVAAAVDRFQTQGSLKIRRLDSERAVGANYKRPAKQGQLQRLVPAGSMYWLEVVQVGEPIQNWNTLMLEPTCRAEYGRDGLGLAIYAKQPTP